MSTLFKCEKASNNVSVSKSSGDEQKAYVKSYNTGPTIGDGSITPLNISFRKTKLCMPVSPCRKCFLLPSPLLIVHLQFA